jgi:hypothetical protein
MTAIEAVDECMVAQICIDRYLWSLYERTRKIDTIKVPEQIKVTFKRNGKTKIVTKTITKLVDEDLVCTQSGFLNSGGTAVVSVYWASVRSAVREMKAQGALGPRPNAQKGPPAKKR